MRFCAGSVLQECHIVRLSDTGQAVRAMGLPKLWFRNRCGSWSVLVRQPAITRGNSKGARARSMTRRTSTREHEKAWQSFCGATAERSEYASGADECPVPDVSFVFRLSVSDKLRSGNAGGGAVRGPPRPVRSLPINSTPDRFPRPAPGLHGQARQDSGMWIDCILYYERRRVTVRSRVSVTCTTACLRCGPFTLRSRTDHASRYHRLPPPRSKLRGFYLSAW